MKKSSYSFKLGEFSCWVINDGTCHPPDSLKEYSSKANQSELDITVLLIKTRSHITLVDTGWGAGADAAPKAGLLTQNLETTGIKREEIDSIIFSHAHIDHIGGHIDASGNPIFPNARYYMYRKEWEFWTVRPDLSSIPEDVRQGALLAVQRNLIPIKDKINLFEDSRDIVPGIAYMPVPGHSPGNIMLLVSSGSQRLLCLFDAFHNPIEVENPELILVPPMTAEAGDSRKRILSQIKSDDLIFAGHFPFPGIGHIASKDNTWHWQPIITDQLT
jgi:glyoxylase-like metal-dependent hydrolase (beta-lactamase superfamily II)